MKAVFLRITSAEKAAKLHDAINGASDVTSQRFTLEPREFSAIPRSPFAYWVNPSLRSLFVDLESFSQSGRTAKVGLQTSDDFRFVRLWWEVSPQSMGSKWFPFTKGGKYSPYYADQHLVVGYSRGDQVALMAGGRFGRGADLYFRPGITWPVRAIGFSPNAVPAGCIFSARGYLAVSAPEDLSWLLGLMASAPFDALFRIGLSGERPEYVVGVLFSVPIPAFTPARRDKLGELAKEAWRIRRELDTTVETSHAFVAPALLRHPGSKLSIRHEFWRNELAQMNAEFSRIQSEIDEICFEAYGISGQARDDAYDWLNPAASTAAASEAPAEDETRGPEVDEEPTAVPGISLQDDVHGLISWCVGVTFGRFQPQLRRDSIKLPGPFEALPLEAPAMRASEGADENRPQEVVELLVEDDEDGRDIVRAITRVCGQLLSGADQDLLESAELARSGRGDWRIWLAQEFFEYHLKQYARSARRAPLYWQLADDSSTYGIWVYAPRVTRDTLFKLQREVVEAKLSREERRLDEFQKLNATGAQRASRELSGQLARVDSLRAFLDEIKRVAPLWNPNLDDGIVLVKAPLWRLVQHKAWQKELKQKWDELCDGKYDWSHQAMHLWPERVVPKCAEDRSLAIAHGLEDVFWVEDDDGKWTKRAKPTRPIDELVRERTSPAVRAARDSLIEVSQTAPTSGRGKRGRKEGGR